MRNLALLLCLASASAWAEKALGNLPSLLAAVALVAASHALSGRMDKAQQAMQRLLPKNAGLARQPRAVHPPLRQLTAEFALERLQLAGEAIDKAQRALRNLFANGAQTDDAQALVRHIGRQRQRRAPHALARELVQPGDATHGGNQQAQGMVGDVLVVHARRMGDRQARAREHVAQDQALARQRDHRRGGADMQRAAGRQGRGQGERQRDAQRPGSGQDGPARHVEARLRADRS